VLGQWPPQCWELSPSRPELHDEADAALDLAGDPARGGGSVHALLDRRRLQHRHVHQGAVWVHIDAHGAAAAAQQDHHHDRQHQGGAEGLLQLRPAHAVQCVRLHRGTTRAVE